MSEKAPKLTAYQQEIIDRIGNYTLRRIDGTWSLWKKLNDHYDVEIMGSHDRSMPFTVTVFDISNGDWHPPVVEYHENIKGLATLEHIVTEVEWKFSGRDESEG